MEPEFVDRSVERSQLRRTIQVRQAKPRVIVVDSPAGMGKTRLILEVCRDLVMGAFGHQAEWRIVRLDFREGFPRRCRSEYEVIEEVARQLCRDTAWERICELIQDTDPDVQLLIQQAAFVPMETADVRHALLRAVAGVPRDVLEKIQQIIAEAFASADIQQAVQEDRLSSIDGLAGFILDRCYPEQNRIIPRHVLVVLDGVDAIERAELRHWVVNDLASYLGTFPGLQQAFDRLAVLVSGRFIEQDLDSTKRRRRFQEMVLRSFTEKPVYVEDLICQFPDPSFSKRKDLVQRLARKLCQACGGHPRVIKETAEMLHAGRAHFMGLGMEPEEVGYWYEEDGHRGMLRGYRDAAIAEILTGVGDQERRLLKLLSAFRRFTPATLEFLSRKVRQHEITEYHACFDNFDADIRELYDNLRQTRLVGNDQAKGPFDSERFSLSLLSAYLHDQEPELFSMLNEWAVELFANWIRGKFSDEADAPLKPNHEFQRVGVCEWLFHTLHLAECCDKFSDADQLGEGISAQLRAILEDILPFPGEPRSAQWERIGRDVEEDEQIDHLMWEIALEDDKRHEVIREKILDVFA